MIERHLAKLRARATVSAEEEAAIRSSLGEIREFAADEVVVPALKVQDHSTMLLDGFMCRFKDLRNGKRQITELHVAGDFADLHSFTLKYLDHDVIALTPCRAALVPHANLRRITEQFPHLTRLYWFSTNLDAAIHREWELSLGQRTARARLAALFSELQIRLQIVGLASDTSFDLPLTQTDIAECMGLTNVHVNRTLRNLKEDRLVEFEGRRLTILNKAELWRAGDFDPRYLYLDGNGTAPSLGP
ncbi:Crp/Fnr family transcriptional regulator [Sphingomonas aracearum]|uniref:Crp/Fnr family transcriptional regulator n=1 Tax=Sphingomonas aracearum TaxID=2283317 RepID=A0A369W0E2_9SPHN|nr:Crp/Fnr family transcriptional regulator [Sphingomonas aracearum]RDE07355.1 Crp/Fnr family transcriptional regulator [Sphingomonas aracearum]